MTEGDKVIISDGDQQLEGIFRDADEKTGTVRVVIGEDVLRFLADLVKPAAAPTPETKS
jgi:hypothetical protein